MHSDQDKRKYQNGPSGRQKNLQRMFMAAIASGLLLPLFFWAGQGRAALILYAINILIGIVGVSLASRALQLSSIVRIGCIVTALFPILNILTALILLLQLRNASNIATISEQENKLTAIADTFGLAPVYTTPSLTTINGLGFKLYGKSDYDPKTDSYMTTHYCVVFFIPLFPVARYRVISPDNFAYQFLGKGKLRGVDWFHLIVFVALVIYAIKTAGLN